MTLEIGILLLILAGMAVLFFTEKLPVDLTAFLGLTVLIFLEFLEPKEAFQGFASPAVITMLAIFFVSGALLHTGVADAVGAWVHRRIGSREVPLIVTIMVVAGVLSAFMNNIAAVAVLLPAVASIAKQSGLSPARLFMPLSFGAILGGTTTLVGTPPNILAAEMLQERGMDSFSLFDFFPMGVVLLGTGILYMVLVGRKLLPRGQHGQVSDERDLAGVYQIQDRLFTLSLPADSPIAGQSLRESELGSALGIQVLRIIRGEETITAPGGDTVLSAGDVLVVEGDLSQLRKRLRVQTVEPVNMEAEKPPLALDGVSGVTGCLRPESPLVGQRLDQIRFRERFHALVTGIARAGEMLHEDLARVELQADDQLFLVAMDADRGFNALAADLDLNPIDAPSQPRMRPEVHAFRVPDDSKLMGQTVGSAEVRRMVGLSIVGVLRDGETALAVLPDMKILAGDILWMTGPVERMHALLRVGPVEVGETVTQASIASEDVGMVEATFTPRSQLAGQTLGQLQFRDRYGLQVLALWREGEARFDRLAEARLRFGDALLLQGSWSRIRLLGTDPNFVVLSSNVQKPKRTHKAKYALGALGLMIALVVTGYQPIHVAAFVAAVAVVLSGAISMEEAYRSVEWRAIFLVAAILPVGIAMERTGAADLISTTVTSVAGPWGVYAVLAGLFVLSSFLSQCLDGAPAVVLLTPIALGTAESLGISVMPVMMGISLAASAAFMTPFSHKANLLVMGAGGYKVTDYLKVGTPLTIVLLILMVLLVPVFFPI